MAVMWLTALTVPAPLAQQMPANDDGYIPGLTPVFPCHTFCPSLHPSLLLSHTDLRSAPIRPTCLSLVSCTLPLRLHSLTCITVKKKEKKWVNSPEMCAAVLSGCSEWSFYLSIHLLLTSYSLKPQTLTLWIYLCTFKNVAQYVLLK